MPQIQITSVQLEVNGLIAGVQDAIYSGGNVPGSDPAVAIVTSPSTNKGAFQLKASSNQLNLIGNYSSSLNQFVGERIILLTMETAGVSDESSDGYLRVKVGGTVGDAGQVKLSFAGKLAFAKLEASLWPTGEFTGNGHVEYTINYEIIA